LAEPGLEQALSQKSRANKKRKTLTIAQKIGIIAKMIMFKIHG
jgi:hypothetical protein